MPDIFLYQSDTNAYTILLSDPTVPRSGSSVSVSASGNAALFALGSATVYLGGNVTVNLYGNALISSVGYFGVMATKPKMYMGRSIINVPKRKRRP